ncbi:hypothetical protein B0H15DRAFT_927357 [Mycena belliarum]|uniref:Apple domain-containing protein n=1 Tax=Mycena belliarum TaxID=1033014 RepID=A0AAD6ULB1_9AGAR|nr:hypothetical protein B0H15DRAFT_927357 [Mycena belliae]
MRFFSILIPALYIFAPAAFALDAARAAARQTALNIRPDNHYGAPIPPWQPNSVPGWYFGRPQYAPSGLVCLVGGVGHLLFRLLCDILELLLGCGFCPNKAPPIPPPPPPPVGPTTPTPTPPETPDGYTNQYANKTCASETWPIENYLTFGIVESIQGCADMCDKVVKCIFFNSYHDVNAGAGKAYTTKLTCALFAVVVPAANATNCGNQQQQGHPVGVTQITDSYAYFKPHATVG